METDSSTEGAITVAELKKQAQKIFNDHIVGDSGTSVFFEAKLPNSNKYNLWRLSWAYDTINDYFNIFPEEALKTSLKGDDSVPLYKQILKTYFAPDGGNWWDDYGWTGVATLRAASSTQVKYDSATCQEYIQMAFNSWAYTYGPNWSSPGVPTKDKPSVPFPKLCDWGTWLSKKSSNVGAPNVYENMPFMMGIYPKVSFKPGVEGALWNFPIQTPPTTPQDDPNTGFTAVSTDLLGIQNTVTNGLHTVIALRLLHAQHSMPSDFAAVLAAAKVPIDMDVVFDFWKNQMTWFDEWCGKEGADSMKFLAGTGWLIRERAPSFATGKYDSSYFTDMAWSGDQGILIGVMMDYQLARANPTEWIGNRELPVFNNIPSAGEIMNGVYQSMYGDDQGVANVLHPWTFYKDNTAYLDKAFGAGDNGDYRTGNATFYRYLNQMIDNDLTGFIPLGFNELVQTEAINLANISDEGDTHCEGYTYSPLYDGDDYGTQTPVMSHWINRLSCLCLAIRLAELSE